MAGGLFHTLDEQSVAAFHRAVDLVNADEWLLPRHRLVGVNVTVPELDALQAHRAGRPWPSLGAVGGDGHPHPATISHTGRGGGGGGIPITLGADTLCLKGEWPNTTTGSPRPPQ